MFYPSWSLYNFAAKVNNFLFVVCVLGLGSMILKIAFLKIIFLKSLLFKIVQMFGKTC
jgi:hypothetical protein